MQQHWRATTGNISPFSLVHVYFAGLLRRITPRLDSERWVLLHSSALLLSVFLSVCDPVLIASAGSHSSHYIRPSWAPSQCFPLSRQQQHLRAIYLQFIYILYFFFISCAVSLETEFVLYTCWNTCWDRMFIIGCCMLNIISVLKVKRANVLFWIHSSMERKRHRLHEGHYFVHITR